MQRTVLTTPWKNFNNIPNIIDIDQQRLEILILALEKIGDFCSKPLS